MPFSRKQRLIPKRTAPKQDGIILSEPTIYAIRTPEAFRRSRNNGQYILRFDPNSRNTVIFTIVDRYDRFTEQLTPRQFVQLLSTRLRSDNSPPRALLNYQDSNGEPKVQLMLIREVSLNRSFIEFVYTQIDNRRLTQELEALGQGPDNEPIIFKVNMLIDGGSFT